MHGAAATSEVLDAIKSQGYKYSTRGALTVAVVDAAIPPEKKDLIAEAEAKVEQITGLYNMGLMSDEERYRAVIQTWNSTTEKVTVKNMERIAKRRLTKIAQKIARGTLIAREK